MLCNKCSVYNFNLKLANIALEAKSIDTELLSELRIRDFIPTEAVTDFKKLVLSTSLVKENIPKAFSTKCRITEFTVDHVETSFTVEEDNISLLKKTIY